MHGKPCISSSERSISFQLYEWAFPVYHHLNPVMVTGIQKVVHSDWIQSCENRYVGGLD